MILAISAFVAEMATSANVEARITLTPQQEQCVAWGQINNTAVVYQEANEVLANIQDILIRWNKNTLIPYVSDYQRGIRNPHLMITNRSRVNAFSMPGGHIFVSDALIIAFLSREFNPDTGIRTGEQKEFLFGNGYELYGHSAIAATIAHEDSHWQRNFLQRETDVIVSQISRQQEDDLKIKLKVSDGYGYNRKLNELGFSDKLFPKVKQFVYNEELFADKGAMELLDNTDVYSSGSLITVVSRLKDAKEQNKTLTHPTSDVRIHQIIEHIKKLSRGRVQLDKEGHMKLDGKLFMKNGYMPSRYDVTAFDRTVYVAGQLAKSIYKNAKRVTPLEDNYSYSKAGGMYPIVAVNDSTRESIIIDKAAISQYDAMALKENKKSSNIIEMQAVKEIKKFLEK